MDGQTQVLVENIAEALEDSYGEVPSRYVMELTFGSRIGLAIADLIEIARKAGTLNAHIPGYILTSNGAGYVTVDSEYKRLRALGVDVNIAFRIVHDPRYRAALPEESHTETVAAAMRDREERKHDGPFNSCPACHP